MNNSTHFPLSFQPIPLDSAQLSPSSKPDDIIVFELVDFATFMLKDGELFLRLGDVLHVLTDAQKQFFFTDGMGLCNAMGKSIDGAYIRFDSFITVASPEAQPLLRMVKHEVLKIIAQNCEVKS